MKRKITNLLFFILFITIFLSYRFTLAATTSGTLTQDENWSGTINITGDVIVPNDVTLTIEPGTTLNFDFLSDDTSGGDDTSLSEIIINGGSLIAEGTPLNPIVFTSSSGNPLIGDWYGIKFVQSLGNTLSLDYVTVEYTKEHGIKYYCDVAGVFTASIKHSTFRYGNGKGIYLDIRNI
ncbi:MAG: hypothetical protein HY934_05325 [Candidatus Firestonebacteria bacterium]|nr:hypothetical protein [Candidatus Firestonebacteria bacterium]